jgi:general secretion pathway protein G
MTSSGLRKSRQGFTLIEMVVTVTLVGLLASIAFPLVELAERRSRENELRGALRQIRTALDRYRQAVDEGRILEETKGSGYPPSLEILVAGVVDAKSPNRSQKIYFLRNVPQDPLAPDTNHTGVGWGLRSYASSRENPQPGADIFDVYSLAQGTGLNGIAYREW